MSSTNRGAERSKFDYYVTPIPAIKHFLSEFERPVLLRGEILDPCAGGDANRPMSYPTALTEFSPFDPDIIRTIDIREDSRAGSICDYLKTQMDHQPDVIISNPPFDLAVQFIEKALFDVKEGGIVVMLCRLNFFGSGKRKAFWHSNMPVWAYVHSERMSFTEDGKTDSIEYAHLVWIKESRPRFTQLRVI